jgi:hypothetical protein
MAAMKLYFGENPVGGEVDLAEFEQLQTDVEGKYDKGDPSGLDGGVMQYDNAALMEAAVVANTGEISGLQDDFEELIKALEGFDGSQLEVELAGYFKKYADDDDDQSALIYDSAAKMGLAVAKNTQDIEANKTAITDGDAATLAAANTHSDTNDAATLKASKDYADAQDAVTLTAANTHSDANDAVTLKSANDYTDAAVSAIPGIDGLEQFEETVEELDQNAVRNWNMANDIPDLGGSEGVKNVAVLGALPDTPDANTLYIITG